MCLCTSRIKGVYQLLRDTLMFKNHLSLHIQYFSNMLVTVALGNPNSLGPHRLFFSSVWFYLPFKIATHTLSCTHTVGGVQQHRHSANASPILSRSQDVPGILNSRGLITFFPPVRNRAEWPHKSHFVNPLLTKWLAFRAWMSWGMEPHKKN